MDTVRLASEVREMRRIARFVLVVPFAITAGSAMRVWACGDKFVLLGRSIRFEEAYAAKHPAAVLVYLDPKTGFGTLGKDVFAILKRAGHKPVAAEGKAALEEVLRSNPFDVVLTDVVDKEMLDLEVKALANRPAVLAVVSDAAGKKLEASEKDYGCLLEVSGGGKTRYFLSVVNEVLRTRAKGKRLKCERG
jgi:hypothetical protein